CATRSRQRSGPAASDTSVSAPEPEATGKPEPETAEPDDPEPETPRGPPDTHLTPPAPTSSTSPRTGDDNAKSEAMKTIESDNRQRLTAHSLMARWSFYMTAL